MKKILQLIIILAFAACNQAFAQQFAAQYGQQYPDPQNQGGVRIKGIQLNFNQTTAQYEGILFDMDVTGGAAIKDPLQNVVVNQATQTISFTANNLNYTGTFATSSCAKMYQLKLKTAICSYNWNNIGCR